MKVNSLLILVIAIVLLSGCKRDNPLYPTAAPIKAYITVTCSNCQVQYGMPDQYHQVSVSGTSTKLAYNYTGNYTLVAYITPLNVADNVTISVYNNQGVLVYNGSKQQSAGSYWETDTIVASDL